jgi:hypothetical protein
VCPDNVDVGDTFDISQTADSITATRTDNPNAGWGLQLTVTCCGAAASDATESSEGTVIALAGAGGTLGTISVTPSSYEYPASCGDTGSSCVHPKEGLSDNLIDAGIGSWLAEVDDCYKSGTCTDPIELIYTFSNPVTVSMYRLWARPREEHGSGQGPNSWSLYGADASGSSWTQLHDVVEAPTESWPTTTPDAVCVEVSIGSTNGDGETGLPTKTVPCGDACGLVCPDNVDVGDTFDISQTADSITATRTDNPNAGWGLQLTVTCCGGTTAADKTSAARTHTLANSFSSTQFKLSITKCGNNDWTQVSMSQWALYGITGLAAAPIGAAQAPAPAPAPAEPVCVDVSIGSTNGDGETGLPTKTVPCGRDACGLVCPNNVDVGDSRLRHVCKLKTRRSLDLSNLHCCTRV